MVQVNPLAQFQQNLYNAGSPARARGGVTFMPPAVAAPRARRPLPVARQAAASGVSLADRIRANPEAFAENAMAPTDTGGGLKQDAVHGLGWIIGNPVSKAILKPLEVLDYGRAAVTGGARQLLDTAAMEELNQAIAKLPGIKYSPIRNPEYEPGWQWGELWEDIKKREGFGTSIVEPAFGPEGTNRGIWTRRGLGFAGDVGADPLAWLSGGTRAASGAAARFGYLNKLLDAQQVAGAEVKAATEAADAIGAAAKAGWRTTDEVAAAREAAQQAQKRLDDLSKIGDRNAIDVIGRRGVNVANRAQAEAMGVPRHAVRLSGVPIEEVFGAPLGRISPAAGEAVTRGIGRVSEPLSRGVSRALSPGKELFTQTAGRQARKLVTPKGVLGQTLRPATERILTGQGPMTPEIALRTHAVDEAMRLARGEFRAPARQFLSQLSENLKGVSNDERSALIREAEEQGTENATTKMAGQMIETMRSMGLDPPELKPWTLPNGAQSKYVMPHVLSRDAFRFFNKLRKGDNPLIDFIRRDLGVTDRDLLEEGGFLQRRLFRPNADGSPQTFKIGKEDIEITTGSVAELEDKLGGLLRKHGFEGKLYESNPVEAWRRYIKSTEKDVARNVATEYGADTFGLPGLRRKPEAPIAYDPFGRDIKMVPAEGGTEPRYVRGAAEGPAPVSDDVYQMVEDEAATAARNKIIADETHAQVLGEFQEAAPAVRENLARQIENTREYTEAAFERARAQSARHVERAQAVVDAARARVDKLETEYRELLKESSANEELIRATEGRIHGIRSVTPKRIRAKQQQRLADIAESLQMERDRLEALQTGLENALTRNTQEEREAALQLVRDLDDAVTNAELDLKSTRGKAKQAVTRRIEREHRNYTGAAPHADHLIDAAEHRRALEIVGATDSPAAQRAQELLARQERHTAAAAQHRAEAVQLQEQADRLDDRLRALGARESGRTAEQRTRLAAARAEMTEQVNQLRRQAHAAQNRANTSTRSLRDAERRIKDDEWLKAQRTVEWYDEQQAMIEGFSNGRDIDMNSAKSRLNAARNEQLRYRNEQRLATEAAAAADMAALEASVRQPIPALEEILGPGTKVRYRKIEPTHYDAANSHVIEVSRDEDAIASIRWDAETGKVQGITVAEEYQRQGIGTALYDQATQYAEERALVPPKHAPGEQTVEGAAWAPAADARIANKPESTVPTGTESEAAGFARRSLDTDEARAWRADETLRSDLQDRIARETRGPGEAPAAEWSEVGRKVAKEPRARTRWRAYNSRRRSLLGEMERVRGEADLTAPPTREAFQAESYKQPKPRPPSGRQPKWMKEYRAKPSTRRLRGEEPWWTGEYPSRPDLTRSVRSRNARLRKLQDELDKVERWLDKHPEPPLPRPAARAVKLRAKVGGKMLRLERQTDVGPLGGATWKLTLPGGVEQTLTGDMAQVMRQAETAMYELGARQPDEALLASLREQLANVEQRMAQHRPELVEHITQQRKVLAQSLREQSLMEPKPIRPPTKEELIRSRYEPKIEAAERNVKRFGAINAREELEGIRRTEQIAASQQITGLQGEVESLRFQNQQIERMITDLYGNRMPDPVNDWRLALDNADQARVIHQQISDYIDQFRVRQRALDIVEKNRRAGAPTRADLERVIEGTMEPADAQGLMRAVDDIKGFMTNADQILPKGVRDRIEAALMTYEQSLATLTTTNDIPATALDDMIRQANNGKLPKVLKAQLRDTWREVGQDSGIIIDKELQRAFFGVEEILDSKLFGPLFTTWTNFFKTYATLTPGFHVRNAISAIFMNATEGVGARTQMRAIKLWKQYRAAENPIEYLAGLSAAERDAFRATFASGAGGQFLEAGVGEARAGAGRATERLFANPATRLSKGLGEWVEGPQRLALGLHTTARGGTAGEALARISRIHFDYSQVSKFDEQMKRIIPFWTFMSRNVPLQFTQMWMKPKTYLRYQSAIRNLQLGTEDEPIIPSYITRGGGVYFGAKTPKWAEKIPIIGPPAGMPIVLQPDLPQARYADDLQRLTNALSGEGLGQMATNLNPLLTVPGEFVSRTDFFTGQRFDPEDMVQVGGAALPYAVALSLVGQARRGADGKWYVDAAALNAIRGLDPNLDRMMRLAPQLGGLEATDKTGASTTARQAESLARWAGLPVRTISEQQQRSELRSRAFKEREQRRKKALSGG